MLKSIWKDPVWAAVISTGITAAIGAAGTYALNLWPTIGAWAAQAWSYMGRPSQVPNWVVWVLVLLGLPTIGGVAAIIWVAVRPTQEAETLRTYTQDHFLGLRWRWNYFPSGKLEDPLPFCPHCDYQLQPHQASAYAAIDRIGFHCDSCGTDLPTFDESFDSLQGKIRRFIQQKIRSGDWRASSAT